MSRNLRPLVLLAALPLIVGAIGCKKPKPTPAAAVQATPVPTATPIPIRPTDDFKSPTPDVKEEDLSLKDIIERGYLRHVYFDFDAYDIRSDQRDTLEKNAAWLTKNPKVKVRIEGHCDERGTREYNMALGEKRANSTKEFLVSLGVDGSRIETISYGKERPFAPGHDESAWSQNRRAHFLPIAK